jgi:hypothetical protein
MCLFLLWRRKHTVFETLRFVVTLNSRRWTKSRNPVILNVIHQRQNMLESTYKGSVHYGLIYFLYIPICQSILLSVLCILLKSYFLLHDRLCGLVVRVPGYTTDMYCVSCEVRTEFICYVEVDRLCGLVVRVPGCRSRGPGSIRGVTRFSEKWWVWNGVHSASWVQLRSYLEENVAAPV